MWAAVFPTHCIQYQGEGTIHPFPSAHCSHGGLLWSTPLLRVLRAVYLPSVEASVVWGCLWYMGNSDLENCSYCRGIVIVIYTIIIIWLNAPIIYIYYSSYSSYLV